MTKDIENKAVLTSKHAVEEYEMVWFAMIIYIYINLNPSMVYNQSEYQTTMS